MASHGIPRATAAEEVPETARLREQEKIKSYRELVRQVQEQRSKRDYSQDALDNVSRLLTRNPEFYTIWNIRREILQAQISRLADGAAAATAAAAAAAGADGDAKAATPTSTPQQLIQQILESDMRFIFPLLKKSPKCYWIWNHRVWLLEQTTTYLPLEDSLAFWAQELVLVGKMLSLDNRNFHGWGYRRKVVAEIERLRALRATAQGPAGELYADSSVERQTGGDCQAMSSMARDELAYTTAMVKLNLSNFSAWHSRMRTIVRLLAEEDASDEARKQMFESELDLVHRALIDPYDQSLWFYHQNLMCNLLPTTQQSGDAGLQNLLIAPRLSTAMKAKYLEAELEELRDILDSANDCKWVYLALIDVRKALWKTRGQGRDIEAETGKAKPDDGEEVAVRDDITQWLAAVKRLDPLRKARWEEMEAHLLEAE
ncbi:Rab geranylgeranyltransferase [Ascosphaera acerosa]|nr:Rab geranylgeranyltransferase [Ascosphaera acerosa]